MVNQTTASTAPPAARARRPMSAAAAHVAAEIAAALGETEDVPRKQIARAVRVLGAERALAFLAQAQEVERQGGMMVPDGRWRRTPGSVFFHMVRQGVARKDMYRIFRPQAPPARNQ